MSKALSKLMQAVAPFFVGLYLRHVYRRWSRLYRWLWERQYRNVAIPDYLSFLDIAMTLRRMKWVADGPKQLWDAISTPEAVQWRLDNLPGREVGDCDEHAIYIADRIVSAQKKGSFADKNLVEVCFVTITWIVPATGEMGGHNVCGLKWKFLDREMYGYMDYGMPIMASLSWDEVAEAVRVRYSGAQEVVSLGWSRHTPTLDFIEASR